MMIWRDSWGSPKKFVYLPYQAVDFWCNQLYITAQMPIRPNGLILAENGEKLFFFHCFGKSRGIKYKVEIVFTTITYIISLMIRLHTA